jgi:hypothetical protein
MLDQHGIALATGGAGLGLQPVDQVDRGMEAATSAGADAGAGTIEIMLAMEAFGRFLRR